MMHRSTTFLYFMSIEYNLKLMLPAKLLSIDFDNLRLEVSELCVYKFGAVIRTDKMAMLLRVYLHLLITYICSNFFSLDKMVMCAAHTCILEKQIFFMCSAHIFGCLYPAVKKLFVHKQGL